MSIFEVYRDVKDEWRFRLKAANGKTIAVSEGYRKRRGVLNGIESVRENAPGAAILFVEN